jgi:flagellar biosynthesis component FlhA
MNTTIPASWIPEALEVNVSADLAGRLQQSQSGLLRRFAVIRERHGIESPVARIRDDALLAERTYAISINGIRVAGGAIEGACDLESELVGALEAVFERHADAIRFFVEFRRGAQMF